MGCESSSTRDIVARVGDAVLTEGALTSQLALRPDADLTEGERAQLIEDWVRQELIYQEAIARGLHQQTRLKTLLEQMRRDLLIAALLDAEFQDRELAFGEAAIRRYYDAHQADFRRLHPEIRARHILLTSQREANAQRQTLRQRGESFAEVATSTRTTTRPATKAVSWAISPKRKIPCSGPCAKTCRSIASPSRYIQSTATISSRS